MKEQFSDMLSSVETFYFICSYKNFSNTLSYPCQKTSDECFYEIYFNTSFFSSSPFINAFAFSIVVSAMLVRASSVKNP